MGKRFFGCLMRTLKKNDDRQGTEREGGGRWKKRRRRGQCGHMICIVHEQSFHEGGWSPNRCFDSSEMGNQKKNRKKNALDRQAIYLNREDEEKKSATTMCGL